MRKGLPGKIGNVSRGLREIRPVCRLVREAEEGAAEERALKEAATHGMKRAMAIRQYREKHGRK